MTPELHIREAESCPLSPDAAEVVRAYVGYYLTAPTTPPPFPSSRYLRRVHFTQLSRRQWGRAVRELMDAGLIETDHGRITLAVPPEAVPGMEDSR